MSTHAVCHEGKCHSGQAVREESAFEKSLTKLMETITWLARMAFSFYCAPLLFLGFTALGAAWSFFDTTITRSFVDVVATYACSQGILALSGVTVPKIVSLMAAFALDMVHIEHHCEVFAPITGISTGLWLGVHLREFSM